MLPILLIDATPVSGCLAVTAALKFLKRLSEMFFCKTSVAASNSRQSMCIPCSSWPNRPPVLVSLQTAGERHLR